MVLTALDVRQYSISCEKWILSTADVPFKSIVWTWLKELPVGVEK